MQGGLHTKHIIKTSNLEMPLVSIVTPNFNGEKYIEETILSIKNQSYLNIEHIIIDGGSNDLSMEIIQKYEDHIDFFLSEKDKGMYDAINKGFSYSNGEVLAYLNSDDLYDKKCIERVVEVYKRSQSYSLIFGDFLIKDENTQRSYPYKSSNLGKEFILCYCRLPFAQQSTFWTRKIWDEGGPFNTNYKYVGDFDFFARVLLHPKSKIFHLQKVLATFRVHEEALSTHTEIMENEFNVAIYNLGLHKRNIRTLKKFISHWYYRLSNISVSLKYNSDKRKLLE